MGYRKFTTKVAKGNIMSWSGDIYVSICLFLCFAFNYFLLTLSVLLEGYGYAGAKSLGCLEQQFACVSFTPILNSSNTSLLFYNSSEIFLICAECQWKW